jgi:hypothetical protein
VIDISAARAKQRAEAAAAAEERMDRADVAKTRRAPVVLTTRQAADLDDFCTHVQGVHKRRRFREAVLSRLSGAVGTAALRAAITATALDIGFTNERLKKLGVFNDRHGPYSRPGSGKAAQGIQL